MSWRWVKRKGWRDERYNVSVVKEMGMLVGKAGDLALAPRKRGV